MYLFGFELEGFEGGHSPLVPITLPKQDRSTDGFPGLIEIRTHKPTDLYSAYFDLLKQFTLNPFNIHKTEHKFTPKERTILRRREGVKDPVFISNIYGKDPKDLGSRTLASFQINFSKQKTAAYTDNTGKQHSAVYEIFDYVPIIRKLDKLYSKHIKDAKRQEGFYSIKDGCRVEYRSLPNSAFQTHPQTAINWLKLIEECFS